MASVLSSVEIRREDSILLKDFIRVKEISDTGGRLLSLKSLISDVVIPSFVDEVVKPELDISFEENISEAVDNIVQLEILKQSIPHNLLKPLPSPERVGVAKMLDVDTSGKPNVELPNAFKPVKKGVDDDV